MILCVTLNSCLDKTLTVPAWTPGAAVRGRSVRAVVGGKGNNVARALARLGRLARPVTFLGGAVGTHCRELLIEDDGLEPLVVTTAAATRVILTVRTEGSPEQTAFFDPDPAITQAEADALHGTVQAMLATSEVEALTLSGSSPSPATHGLYSELIGLCRTRRVPVFLDTYGPALDAIWGLWPDSIQLNRREAAAHLRTNTSNLTDAQVVALLDRWSRHGVCCAIVTDGPSAAFAKVHGRHYRAHPPAIAAVNPIGSGDSLLAGITDAWLSRLDPELMLRHGLACAVANALVWDAGAIDPSTVHRYAADIVIEPSKGV
jgi:1-phosphofructokinase family hexose kinase